MTTTVCVLYQRLNPVLEVIPVFVPASIRATSVFSNASEGTALTFRVERLNKIDAPCSIRWSVTSPAGSSDFTGVTSGTVNFVANGANVRDVIVQTVNRTGIQGNRVIDFKLADPVSCTIDPLYEHALCTLTDIIPGSVAIVQVSKVTASAIEGDAITFRITRVPSDGKACSVNWEATSSLDDGVWWNLPIRSGRDWAAGPANWTSVEVEWPEEEDDVSIIDAVMGSAVTTPAQAALGRDATDIQAYCHTWYNVIGGNVGGVLDDTGTQFEWATGCGYGFGDAITRLPVDDELYPDGAGWLIWVCILFPDTYGVGTNPPVLPEASPIWDEFIDGDHDNRMKQFGRNIVRRMEITGHPLKRLIINPHREHNKGDTSFKVYPSTRAKYKAAMENAFTQIRAGANDERAGAGSEFKILHRVAYRGNIGDLDTYCPDNVDCVGSSWHPGAAANNLTNLLALQNGTLDDPTNLPDGLYGISTDLPDLATLLNVPIVFPEWSPKFESGDPCPISHTAVSQFHTLLKTDTFKGRLVCDCVYGKNIRDVDAYEGSTTAGDTNWRTMVATRKTLWAGVQEKIVGTPSSRPKYPQTSTKDLSATPSTLQSVYDGAAAGNHIVCAAGTYTNSYSFNRKFSIDNPVVIRGASVHTAVFTGQVDTLSGTGHFLHELKFVRPYTTGRGAALHVGSDVIVTRCWFHAQNGIVLQNGNAIFKSTPFNARKNIWIGWNRFTNQFALAVLQAHIFIMKPGSGVPGTVGNQPYSNAHIYRNFFHDKGTRVPAGDGSWIICIGDSICYDGLYTGMPDNNDQPQYDMYIEENYVPANSTRTRGIYIKNGVKSVARNHFAKTLADAFQQRIGRGTKWWGNRGNPDMPLSVQGGGSATLYDDLRRNDLGGASIELYCGTHKRGSPSTAEHPAADYAFLYGNNAPVKIGEQANPDTSVVADSQGGTIDHVRVYKNIGTVTIEGPARVDTATITVSANEPPGGGNFNPPVVVDDAGRKITDDNGTVISTFDGTYTGMENDSQDTP
jgi:hypothetical protein